MSVHWLLLLAQVLRKNKAQVCKPTEKLRKKFQQGSTKENKKEEHCAQVSNLES
jgi:hypothetical protein